MIVVKSAFPLIIYLPVTVFVIRLQMFSKYPLIVHSQCPLFVAAKAEEIRVLYSEAEDDVADGRIYSNNNLANILKANLPDAVSFNTSNLEVSLTAIYLWMQYRRDMLFPESIGEPLYVSNVYSVAAYDL